MAVEANSETTLELMREFEAEPERVFDVFLNADSLKAIWSMEDFQIVEMSVDPRVGGGWSFAMMEVSTGTINHCTARYAEIVRPSRIVWFTKWLDGPLAGIPEMRVTLKFSAIKNGTRLEVTHEFFPDRETRDHHGSGWASGLEKLGKLLAKQRDVG